MNERSYQRPEGALIQDAAKRERLSMRQLAKAVGISDTRLRHIVNGYQPVGHGQVIEIDAPADTLARIAEAVGVSSDDMRGAGRGDAADEMGRLESVTQVGDTLSLSARGEELRMLREYLDTPEAERPRNPPTKPLALWSITQLLDAVRAVYEDERHFLSFATGHRGEYPDHFEAEEAARRGDLTSGSE